MLRPAFSYHTTFMWFMVCIAGLSVRTDLLGISSIVRVLCLDSACYNKLLRCCHSSAIKLPVLSQLWADTVLKLFGPQIERINGRIILLADGKKIAKSGKKMPGVKCLHQESDANTKPSFIMGHSTQAVSVLARADNTTLAVPLDMKIHEGVVFSNRDKRTLLDKLVMLVDGLTLKEPFYLVADAYYGSGKIIKPLLGQGNHLITRAKSNCAARSPAPGTQGPRKRGRPRLYGDKVKLRHLFNNKDAFLSMSSPAYDEKNVTIKVRTLDLLWEPAGQLVRFVLVEHPSRGRWILMCTDLTLEPREIIRLYALRFKIELGFKQAAHTLGSYGYHFWMADMKRLKRRGGNQYMHHETEDYRQAVRRKLHAFHVFLFMGVVTQGLMHYLSACHTDAVWRSFGSWLRTIRKGVAPTELVVGMALKNTLPEFLLVGAKDNNLAKFILANQRPDDSVDWGIAA